ncbi:MAG: efflux RND transporter periplasmic adaptor subunit [Deltaproteobacteria bacterium]|nr:efflux RND transporter periplasmic adaptor subunit [Deltaproteobacteria bacterium]
MVIERRVNVPNVWVFMLSLLFLAPVGFMGCEKKQKPPPKQPPPVVTVEKVVLQTVPVYLNYVATTQSVKTVDVRARVEGFLEERRFVEGDDVKKGILYSSSKRPLTRPLWSEAWPNWPRTRRR